MKKALLLLILFLTVSDILPQQRQMRAVWITNVDSFVMFTDDAIAEAMDYLAKIGINVVFPVVWNKGYTLYPSAIMQNEFGVPIIANFAGRDPLKTIMIEAHRNGIEVIPWFEFGFSSSYSLNGGHILAKYPQWASKNRQGQLVVKNGFDWMAGTNPELQDFLISLTTEVIDNYDIEGVQGDDRLPAMPSEGGYDSVTVELYKADNNGNLPPQNEYDAAWKRWRANKLNDFVARWRDTVKSRSEDLILSIAPSPYPWGYDNYLQDSKTWVDSGLIDNFIPQLYRQDVGSYTYELNLAYGAIAPARRHILFGGILTKAGSYVISPSLLLGSIQANRNKNVQGESFFFYEAFRQNSNRLGDTLRATYYNEPALLPYRDGFVWRPKSTVQNENDAANTRTGNWTQFVGPVPGGQILWTNDSNYAALNYNIDVPYSAWYDLYVYLFPNSSFTENARYTIFSGTDSTVVSVNQRTLKQKGWVQLPSVFLTKGAATVLRLDNINAEKGKYVMADAAMLRLNRKLSPDVVIVSVEDEKSVQTSLPETLVLEQNYPNPFNPSTKVQFTLPSDAVAKLVVYNTLGEEVATLINTELKAGTHSAEFRADGLSSGIYFLRLVAGSASATRKMMYLK